MKNISPSENNTHDNLTSGKIEESSQEKENSERKEIAKRFLLHLDKDSREFLFQTFDDMKDRKDPALTRVLIGSLDEHFDKLIELNDCGAGVFVTVNQTDGKGRKLKNITRVRAIFQEADRSGVPLPDLEPHIEVSTSPGKYHRYWFIKPETAPSIDEWQAVMNRMAADFGSDPSAKDPSRVLRLPGFYHQKDPNNPHPVKSRVKSKDNPYTWSKITAKIPPLEGMQHKKTSNQSVNKELDQPLKISSAINEIDPDCDYDQWLKIGMAWHHATGGSEEGLKLWNAWSSKASCYRAGETEQKWESFGTYTGEPVTIGTIFHYANEAGWSFETAENDFLCEARIVVKSVITESKTDATAYLSNKSQEAFQLIHASNPAEYELYRTELKQANPKIRLSVLDKLIEPEKENNVSDSNANTLLVLVEKICEFWHDKNGNAYASFKRSIKDQSHTEHWPIESKGFKEWLAQLAHVELKRAISSETLKTVCNTLSGNAKFDGKEHEVFMRVGRNEEDYWIDLCDEHWRAILITTTSWKLVNNPPIIFYRTQSMRPLPVPQKDGNIDLLWQFTNIPEASRRLVLAWIIECYRCNTPYPVLELIGEQGSAKSSTQRVLRRFIDPNQVDLRGKPKTVEDIYVAGGKNHILSYENLSGITGDMSDCLCTVSTGGGYASRQLYTNDDESIIEVLNPVVLNGISAVISRQDLLDRTIAICLPTIINRKNEAEIGQELLKAESSIFGGLLDVFVNTLKTLPSVTISGNRSPRMADFSLLGEAMSQAQGREPEEWLDYYILHRREAVQRTIDASPVAVAIIQYLDKHGSYNGTLKKLLQELLNLENKVERGDYFPKSPKGMVDSLRRIAPALRTMGYSVEQDAQRKRDGFHCKLQKVKDIYAIPNVNNRN